MIIRFFQAVVHDGQVDAFASLFVGTLLPLIREQDGMLEAFVGLPHESSPNAFTMVTRWRDMESLKKFTGESWQTAVIHPDEADLVKEAVVHHYVAPFE